MPPRHRMSEGYLKDRATNIVVLAEQIGFRALLVKHAVEPVTGRDDLELLKALIQSCEDVSSAGGAPVILAPLGPKGSAVFSYHWGWGGRPNLPEDIKLAAKVHEEGSLGMHEVNGYPVLQIQTPDAEFFVIHGAWIGSLVFEGDEVTGVFTPEVLPGAPQELHLKLSWRAEFQESPAPRLP
ncbi:hypothetical protein SAMN05216359_1102 [Roseateles sp. YR242]|nr:hypothetical protein SAMN05216359_1102 [Roseateles sp. YR242]